MAITSEELKTLCARTYADPEFRTHLLADPRKAARRLQIELSQEEAQLLLQGAGAIRAEAKELEAKLSGVNFFIPFPVLKPSDPLDKDRRPRRERPLKGPRELGTRGSRLNSEFDSAAP